MPKAKDLTGREFNSLKVLEFAGYKKYKNGVQHRLYKCQCALCGNICYITSGALTTGHAKSCGCLKRQHATKLGKQMGTKLKEYGGLIDGTRIDHLTNKPTVRSTTGVRGVTYKKDRNKYEANICFKQKNYYLGSYKTLEEAAKVRKAAEDKLFGDFLKWYAEYKTKEEGLERNE